MRDLLVPAVLLIVFVAVLLALGDVIPVTGVDSKGNVTVSMASTPDKTAYACDDGVDYWRKRHELHQTGKTCRPDHTGCAGYHLS